jgi:uncharacterized protein YggT (Ycf19 family)
MAQLETQEVITTSKSAPVQVTQTTKSVTPSAVPTETPQNAYEKKKTIFRTYQIIWYILGVVEILLAFRVILKMLGASVGSPFASLLYMVSDPLALPFSGIFGVTASLQGSQLEWSTLVAMIVYAVIAYGLIQLMQLVKPTTPQEVEQKVDSQ